MRCTVLAVTPLLTLAGCSTRSVNGDHVTYHFSLLVILGIALVSALAMPAGWFLRRFSEKIGYVLLVVGAFGLVLVAPAMWHDRVEVDSDHFACSVGALGGSNHSIPFAELKSIRWIEEESGGRANHTNYFLDCVKTNGTVERVAVGDLMKQAVEEILARARARGVPLEGLPRQE